MQIISEKRQVTLTKDQCQALGIEPGDSVETFVADGQLTLVKKTAGAAKGILGHVKVINKMSDESAVYSALS